MQKTSGQIVYIRWVQDRLRVLANGPHASRLVAGRNRCFAEGHSKRRRTILVGVRYTF